MLTFVFIAFKLFVVEFNWSIAFVPEAYSILAYDVIDHVMCDPSG